jgi:hypothetical protein
MSIELIEVPDLPLAIPKFQNSNKLAQLNSMRIAKNG